MIYSLSRPLLFPRRNVRIGERGRRGRRRKRKKNKPDSELWPVDVKKGKKKGSFATAEEDFQNRSLSPVSLSTSS